MIADQMEDWFPGGAADGFLMVFPELPANPVDFGRDVLPELQRRGLFHDRYEASMLRTRLAPRALQPA